MESFLLYVKHKTEVICHPASLGTKVPGYFHKPAYSCNKVVKAT
jgi:hypothetical protein